MLIDADLALLRRPLHAFVSTVARLGQLPAPRPVWFELADDGQIGLFSFASTPRVAQLRIDPRLGIIVAAPTGEPEAWVAIDGEATLHADGAFELAERLARRYWGDDLVGKANTLDAWRRAELIRIAVRPTAVRRSAG